MKTRDRWIYPIELTSDNNQFVVTKYDPSATNVTFTLDEGIYYNYDGNIPGFPSLLQAIRDAIFDEWGTETTYYNSVPLTSYKFEGGGVKIETTDDVVFNTSNPDFSDVIRRCLGMPETDTEQGQSYLSPFTVWGEWLEPCHGISTHYDNFTKLQFTGPGHSNRTRLVQRWASYAWRRYSYKWCPIALVNSGFEDKADYQDVAKLGLGDNNNMWLDVWEYGLSTGIPILVMTENSYLVVVADGEIMDDFENSITERSELARIYDIDLLVRVRG